MPGRACLAVSTLGLCLAFGLAQARADAVDFYRGRTVQFYIGSAPGGGYDFFGRLIARHLGRFIPGKPNVIPVNMPGAGGLKMAGHLYSIAPKDGSALGILAQTAPLEQAFGASGVQFDAARFTYIGRVAPAVEVTYTWSSSPTKTLEDARQRETVMGGASPDTNTVIYLNVLNALAGTKFRIISGYPGTAELNVALERGEIEGTTKTWEAFRAENGAWLDKGQVRIMLQYALKKAHDLPDTPLMIDLGRTEEERAALRFFASGNEMGRGVMTTPEVPAERTAALRAAFDAMVRDPEFLAEAAQRKIDVDPMGGEDVGALVRAILTAPPEVVERAKKAREGR
jgi:hypothetical protein